MKLKTNKDFLHRQLFVVFSRILGLLFSPILGCLLYIIDYNGFSLKQSIYEVAGSAIGGDEAGYYRLFNEGGSCSPYIWKWSQPRNKNWRQVNRGRIKWI